MQERKDRQISYEAVVENTGDSVGNGIAAECGNRDSESEILCGNSSVLSIHAPMVFVLDTLLLLTPFLLVFFTRRKVFLSSRPFRDSSFDCGHCQQCAAGVSDNPVYCGRSASGEICGNASDNVSDLVADYSDGSGSRCGGYVLRAALAKGHRWMLQKVNLTESGCVAAVTMLVIWGMLNFSVASGPCGASFWKHRPGLQGLWSWRTVLPTLC